MKRKMIIARSCSSLNKNKTKLIATELWSEKSRFQDNRKRAHSHALGINMKKVGKKLIQRFMVVTQPESRRIWEAPLTEPSNHQIYKKKNNFPKLKESDQRPRQVYHDVPGSGIMTAQWFTAQWTTWGGQVDISSILPFEGWSILLFSLSLDYRVLISMSPN